MTTTQLAITPATHQGRAGRVMRACAGAMVLGSLLSGALLLGGCARPMVATQGRSAITATYSFPTLSALLPPEARVPAVIAAAEDAMRARGYSIGDSTATDEMGKVIGRPPSTSSIPYAAVSAKRVWGGTRVEVEWQPLGDEAVCRSILDGILQRLDL